MTRTTKASADWFRILLFAFACICIWFWQYIKFKGHYGLFYRISPEYGLWVLSIITVTVCVYGYFASIRLDKTWRQNDEQ